MKTFNLTTHWQLKARQNNLPLEEDFAVQAGWLAATVPGVVQQDLLTAGQIPDPFYGLNEQQVQWVGEKDWLYRSVFEVEAVTLSAGEVALCFDGLDTFATVWLNGHLILSSENMFVPYRVPVKALLQPGQNELRILFESAFRRGKELEATHGQLTAWNGDISRVYVRKAQYHYGWDWGPCLLTAGPWRGVRLEAYNERIADLTCLPQVSSDLQTAYLPIKVELERPGVSFREQHLRFTLFNPKDELLAETSVTIKGKDEVVHTFEVAQPELWYPNGSGPQPLYRVVAALENGVELDHCELKLGLRSLRLVQEPVEGEPGTSFYFEINNTPVFCGGANWIPADNFVPRLTEANYRLQLEQAAKGNLNMLRVWGGGIYEQDIFYDLCDELGLLVWQDFMFACGIYPAYAEFQASVRAEAVATVRRLRNHACLALWCGNNEDYQVAQTLNAYDVNFEGDFTTTKFPARAIYERLLPEVCGQLDPTRTYWPGSPYAGSNVFDKTVGDRHTWEVWHGNMDDYHNYGKWEGRFISEFGLEAYPALKTIESFTPSDELYPQSRTLDQHNKSVDGSRRLAVYLNDNLRVPAILEDYVYASQFVQAEALLNAYKSFRRRWQGSGRYAVGGALVWQLNDCWPVTSWAIVDYYRHPKPAYYVIKRELALQTVGLARLDDTKVALWVTNNTNNQFLKGEVELNWWTLDGQPAGHECQTGNLPANGALELGEIPNRLKDKLVLSARLCLEGQLVARNSLWPEPFKYLTLPDPDLEISRLDSELWQLVVRRPAKGVWLEATGQTTQNTPVEWSDNMLDLMPGDPQIVKVKGLGDQSIKARWLQ